MAYSTKISFYPSDTTKPCIEIEPNWWGSRELINDPRFVACGPNSSYHDYEAYLTTSEMIEMYEKYRPMVLKDCEYEPWKNKILPMLDQIEDILYIHSELYSRILVEVFEWESGC